MGDAIPTFRLVASRRWSRGGLVVQRNIAQVAREHPDLLGDDPRSPFAFVPLNWAHPGRVGRTPFVLMPQNVWPWAGEVAQVRPRLRRSALRVASELSMRRAMGVIRLGEQVPDHRRPLGGVLSNVLDDEFEHALERSLLEEPLTHTDPAFVCVGSWTTYRGIHHLVEGYTRYRRGGGTVPLVIAGSGIPAMVSTARATDGITVVDGTASRTAVLATFRRATAAIFPSTVEASGSITLLEALATCRAVLASDIPGHRSTGHTDTFRLGDPDHLAAKLTVLEAHRADPPDGAPVDSVQRRDERATARAEWCRQLELRLRDAADRAT